MHVKGLIKILSCPIFRNLKETSCHFVINDVSSLPHIGIVGLV